MRTATTWTAATKLLDERGPCWAVEHDANHFRNQRIVTLYATAQDARAAYGRMSDEGGFPGLCIHPPAGAVPLAELAAAREEAKSDESLATFKLRAAVLAELDKGRAEAEVAREARVDRMTVRSWRGK